MTKIITILSLFLTSNLCWSSANSSLENPNYNTPSSTQTVSGTSDLNVENSSANQFLQSVVKVNDSLYYQDLPQENLRVVIERLDDSNREKWENLAEFEVNYGDNLKTSFMENNNMQLTGHPLDGARHFKMVLDKINNSINQVWIAYLTDNLALPQTILADAEWRNSILYCMTVVTSEKALITSHMGINKTIAGVRKKFRGSSIYLHSLAARVMLALNPARRFMINAPAWVMESIIADALPDGLYAGTIEGKEELEKIGNMSFKGWLESSEGQAKKISLIKEGYEEESAAYCG